MEALVAGVGRTSALFVGVPRPEGGTRTDVVVVHLTAAIAVIIVRRLRTELQLGLLQQKMLLVARRRMRRGRGGAALGMQGGGFRARLKKSIHNFQKPHL